MTTRLGLASADTEKVTDLSRPMRKRVRAVDFSTCSRGWGVEQCGRVSGGDLGLAGDGRAHCNEQPDRSGSKPIRSAQDAGAQFVQDHPLRPLTTHYDSQAGYDRSIPGDDGGFRVAVRRCYEAVTVNSLLTGLSRARVAINQAQTFGSSGDALCHRRHLHQPSERCRLRTFPFSRTGLGFSDNPSRIQRLGRPRDGVGSR